MITTKRQDDGKHGVAEAFWNNDLAGKMTYTWAGETKIIIDHTEVDERFSGRGIGKHLLNVLVEFARERNLKIMPLCPFARAMFEKNQDLSDVLF